MAILDLRLRLNSFKVLTFMDAMPKLPESVVRPLCQPFRKAADSVLDLFALTQNPSSPGQCVQCFFRLLQAADSQSQSALEPLKAWIETNIEVAILAGESTSGSFPISLEHRDLQQFCQQAIERVRMDTIAHHRPIELMFRYKASVA